MMHVRDILSTVGGYHEYRGEVFSTVKSFVI